eukprot:NODE_285_length_10753_cov_0.438615.p4 type:complete len:308 gc:universal NODE_285_length_10753_cov_0.438615:7045-7968(+)
MFKNYGNTCWINSILYCFYYSTALNSMLAIKVKETNNSKKQITFIGLLNDTIQDGKLLPELIKFLSKNFPSYKYGHQFDAHEFLLYILDHIRSDWYTIGTDIQNICSCCQIIYTEKLLNNCTLIYNSEGSFGDSLIKLQKDTSDLYCGECGCNTLHLQNLSIAPPLLWCFQFPHTEKRARNILLPTEFEYQNNRERYTYCLVCAVVHIQIQKEFGHYITFIHNDKRVYKSKLGKSKSLESLKSKSGESLEQIPPADISCTYSNKAKFIKCDDDEITDITGTEMYQFLNRSNHFLYMIWYQRINKSSI